MNNIDYLRISVTDRCNLNCMYCLPFGKQDFIFQNEILRYEEIARIVKVFSKIGVRKVRITGGEPLIRRNLVALIKMIRGIEEINEISMTTNALLLKNNAKPLKEAGLGRINVSLNTLRKDRFFKIAGFDGFENAWQGVLEAVSVGLLPLKINVIVFKGINDDEIIDFANLTVDNEISIRFIEYFPTRRMIQGLEDLFVPNYLVKAVIEEKFGRLKTADNFAGNGPANNYYLEKSKGTIGFINSNTENFCGSCTRLRLSANGKVFPCLFSDHHLDLKKLIRNNLIEDEQIQDLLRRLVKSKPDYSKYKNHDYEFQMSSIGG